MPTVFVGEVPVPYHRAGTGLPVMCVPPPAHGAAAFHGWIVWQISSRAVSKGSISGRPARGVDDGAGCVGPRDRKLLARRGFENHQASISPALNWALTFRSSLASRRSLRTSG